MQGRHGQSLDPQGPPDHSRDYASHRRCSQRSHGHRRRHLHQHPVRDHVQLAGAQGRRQSVPGRDLLDQRRPGLLHPVLVHHVHYRQRRPEQLHSGQRVHDQSGQGTTQARPRRQCHEPGRHLRPGLCHSRRQGRPRPPHRPGILQHLRMGLPSELRRGCAGWPSGLWPQPRAIRRSGCLRRREGRQCPCLGPDPQVR